MSKYGLISFLSKSIKIPLIEINKVIPEIIITIPIAKMKKEKLPVMVIPEIVFISPNTKIIEPIIELAPLKVNPCDIFSVAIFAIVPNDLALPFVGKSKYYQVCRIFLPMKGNASYKPFHFAVFINLPSFHVSFFVTSPADE